MFTYTFPFAFQDLSIKTMLLTVADARGLQDFSDMVRSSGKEEIFNTDVAYSEQAAILLKGSPLPESRRIKEENTVTVRAMRHFSELPVSPSFLG